MRGRARRPGNVRLVDGPATLANPKLDPNSSARQAQRWRSIRSAASDPIDRAALRRRALPDQQRHRARRSLHRDGDREDRRVGERNARFPQRDARLHVRSPRCARASPSTSRISPTWCASSGPFASPQLKIDPVGFGQGDRLASAPRSAPAACPPSARRCSHGPRTRGPDRAPSRKALPNRHRQPAASAKGAAPQARDRPGHRGRQGTRPAVRQVASLHRGAVPRNA